MIATLRDIVGFLGDLIQAARCRLYLTNQQTGRAASLIK
jgi:hypothetical protein